MKFKHIIWDWNGTLWDDTWLCVEINNHMLERRDLPLIDIGVYTAKLCFPVRRNRRTSPRGRLLESATLQILKQPKV